MELRQGFLSNRFWLWTGVLISAIALACYIVVAPFGLRDGSTWTGYGLGIFSAVLIVWLAWLGVMKRRFRSSRSNRSGTVSAHVFLGLAVAVVATLHTGFEFSWTLHTLTYVLLMLVVASGIWGISAYAAVPDMISRNLAESIIEKKRFAMSTLEQLEVDMEEIDKRLSRAMGFLPDAFREPVKNSIERTRIGGGLVSILSGSSRKCATARAFVQVRDLIERGHFSDEERRRLVEVVSDLARKREVAACLRRDGRYRAIMQIWLWVHVPLTMALIFCLISHVVVVHFYW